MKTLGWTLFPLLAFATLASAAGPEPQFDAARLKTGSFTYQDSLDGKPGTLSTTTVTRLPDGSYRFTADFPAFDQSWSTVATRAMAPVSTELRMRTREGRHYVMTLKYAGLKVSGEAVTSPSADERLPGQDQAVEGEITPGTVDQRIDWATVMSADSKPGESFEFQVYDAKTGSSRVHCEVSDAGMLDTAIGRVHALKLHYTVAKSSGAEEYTVYTSVEFPRLMLREDLRGDLVTTLQAIKP